MAREPAPKSPTPPFIKWKPLKTAGDQAKENKERRESSKKHSKERVEEIQEPESERSVSYRSPSPLPCPAPKSKTPLLPKYLVDGRTAYYICRVSAWLLPRSYLYFYRVVSGKFNTLLMVGKSRKFAGNPAPAPAPAPAPSS